PGRQPVSQPFASIPEANRTVGLVNTPGGVIRSMDPGDDLCHTQLGRQGKKGCDHVRSMPTSSTPGTDVVAELSRGGNGRFREASQRNPSQVLVPTDEPPQVSIGATPLGPYLFDVVFHVLQCAQFEPVEIGILPFGLVLGDRGTVGAENPCCRTDQHFCRRVQHALRGTLVRTVSATSALVAPHRPTMTRSPSCVGTTVGSSASGIFQTAGTSGRGVVPDGRRWFGRDIPPNKEISSHVEGCPPRRAPHMAGWSALQLSILRLSSLPALPSPRVRSAASRSSMTDSSGSRGVGTNEASIFLPFFFGWPGAGNGTGDHTLLGSSV